MALRFYNTLNKEKETFEPLVAGKVGMYVCGPTVYKDSHIGHAVGPVIFDALKKYLTYKGYDVTLVVNITDVDDKLIIESEQRGMSVADLAAEVSAGYFEAMDKLGVDSIDVYPRATDHIEHIIKLIEKISAQGAAYEAAGDVYCDVSKSADYGKLSHRRIEDQMEGGRDLAGEGKRNAADFALWKSAGADEIGWDSPWGRGRPGWHIECSAMSMAYLGESFDIHGGGMDLIFPHHENEICQSELANGKPYVTYWMHNGLTRMRTKAASGEWQAEKMSKSLGNVKVLKELLTEYPPALIRFFLLSTHYRRPIDFSGDSLEATHKGMMNIYRTLERVERVGGGEVFGGELDMAAVKAAAKDADAVLVEAMRECERRYVEALDDDFNTAAAIATLYDLCGAINRHVEECKLETKATDGNRAVLTAAGRMVTTLGQIIGLLTEPLESATAGGDDLTEKVMQVLIEVRAQARQEKNFGIADAIRDKLKAIDITLEDRPDGTGWSRG